MELTMTLTHSHKQRDEKWIKAAEKYMQYKKDKMYYEEKEKEYFEELKALSQGVASKGAGYVFTPTYRKGSVDYTAIPELKGVDLDRYRNDAVEVWKLTYELMGE